MKKPGKFEDDILRKYINPENIEKSPEGFTGRLMTQIQLEKVPVKAPDKFRINYLVPAISVTVAVLLIISAAFFGTTENITANDPIIRFVDSIRIPFPDIKFDYLSNITIPRLISYLVIGLFVLALFDRVLNSVFYRKEKQ
jgi:hypothetical protein